MGEYEETYYIGYNQQDTPDILKHVLTSFIILLSFDAKFKIFTKYVVSSLNHGKIMAYPNFGIWLYSATFLRTHSFNNIGVHMFTVTRPLLREIATCWTCNVRLLYKSKDSWLCSKYILPIQKAMPHWLDFVFDSKYLMVCQNHYTSIQIWYSHLDLHFQVSR